jgi:N-terminal domain of reverse transcriptase
MTALSTATTEEKAGAASRSTVDWHAIDWRRVTHNVRRLQVRIVKAIQAGKWGKAKALQRLLTCRSYNLICHVESQVIVVPLMFREDNSRR